MCVYLNLHLQKVNINSLPNKKGKKLQKGGFFNPLPVDKILGLPKLKAIADDKLNVTRNVEVVFHRI